MLVSPRAFTVPRLGERRPVSRTHRHFSRSHLPLRMSLVTFGMASG